MIQIKRAYEETDTGEGFRILVDRLWPRGLSKEKAKIDLWLKDIAPSPELRKWFSHDVKKWPEFQKRYRQELQSNNELINEIKKHEKENKIVTLLYSAKDTLHNNAVVLRDYLKQ